MSRGVSVILKTHQKRIEALRDSVADSIVRLFGEHRPAFAGLHEEELLDMIWQVSSISVVNLAEEDVRGGRTVKCLKRGNIATVEPRGLGKFAFAPPRRLPLTVWTRLIA